MSTVINNPGGGESSGMGLVVGIVVAIIAVGLFFFFVLPAIRGGGQGGKDANINVDVKLPEGGGGDQGGGGQPQQ